MAKYPDGSDVDPIVRKLMSFANCELARGVNNISDALTASITDDNLFLISSPNIQGFIPEPPIGTRSVSLRCNFKYGMDDDINWPQNFHEFYCHMACVPRCPRDSSDKYWEHGVMWRDLTLDDVESAVDIAEALVRVKPGYSDELKAAHRAIQAEVSNPATDLAVESSDTNVAFNKDYLQHQRDILSVSLDILCNTADSFQKHSRSKTEFARAWLSLTAFLTYIKVYRPRIADLSAISVTPKGDFTPTAPLPADWLQGCFTSDQVVVLQLCRAQIPVWFIRPVSQLKRSASYVQIVRGRPLTRFPSDQLTLHDPPMEIIFQGTSGDPERIYAIQEESRSLFRYANPMVSRQTQSRPIPYGSNPLYPSPVGAIRSNAGPSQRHSPYNSAKANAVDDQKRTELMDKCKELFGEYAPPAITAWYGINAKINLDSPESKSHCKTSDDSFYWFPDPLLVLKAQPYRIRAYLRCFRNLQSAMIIRLKGEKALPMASKRWREVLDLGILISAAEEHDLRVAVTTGVIPNKKAGEKAKTRKLVCEWISAMQDANLRLYPDVRHSKSNDPPLDVNEGRALVWQMCELNFRWELMSLDSELSLYVPCKHVEQLHGKQYAYSAWQLSRQALMTRCFVASSLFSVRTTDAKSGLAAPEWNDRLPFLSRLWKLMDSWQCKKPDNWMMAFEHEARGAVFSAEAGADWERGMTSMYAQCFYDRFGRPAILPCTLEL